MVLIFMESIKKAGNTKPYYLLHYYRFEKLCFVLKDDHCQTLLPVESMACNVKWLFVVRLLATSCINASVFVYVAYAGSTLTWSSVLEIKLLDNLHKQQNAMKAIRYYLFSVTSSCA